MSRRAVLADRRVVVYNAEYDYGVWRQAIERYSLGPGCWRESDSFDWLDGGEPPVRAWVPGAGEPQRRTDWECAMEWYALFVGELMWNYDGSFKFKWQRLNGGHDALADCRATLARLHEMAERG